MSDAAAVCNVLIEETPQSGAWNMALDEALLELAGRDGECWLRWYRWSEPAVSLGYFQKVDIPEEFAGLAVVRRLSGGGAILHHHEWTYSVVVAPGHPLAAAPPQLYGLVHDRIIGVLAELGVTAQRRGTAAAFADNSFLCFQRGDANDVLIGQHKILGSAQRRRRGAILQHGSLLMATSPHAPELPGVCDLGIAPTSLQDIATRLAAAVGGLIGRSRSVDMPPKTAIDMAARLKRDRYQSEAKIGE